MKGSVARLKKLKQLNCTLLICNLMKILRKFLFKYIYKNWNIAIADIADTLVPYNIKWMRHGYKDRWFADPFIISESSSEYIILAEEYLRDARRGRLARLTVSKDDCKLLANETILDLDTHLSFPNTIDVEGEKYLYPENAASGTTFYYKYGQVISDDGKVLIDERLADAVIFEKNNTYYLLATVGNECNGNKLIVYKSNRPLGGYKKSQEILFNDNIARRAGHIFLWDGRLISPAQVCNMEYGEGVSLQELTLEDGLIELKEIKRMMPPTKMYPNGFHTYNVWHNGKAIIDGYKYGSNILHTLYFRLRNH